MATTRVKPPVEGAAKCYRIAPVDQPDAFEYVAEKMRNHGWKPVEQDYTIRPVKGGQFVEVALWAIPPTKLNEGGEHA